jgi:hypothetical protein
MHSHCVSQALPGQLFHICRQQKGGRRVELNCHWFVLGECGPSALR